MCPVLKGPAKLVGVDLDLEQASLPCPWGVVSFRVFRVLFWVQGSNTLMNVYICKYADVGGGRGGNGGGAEREHAKTLKP